MKGGRGAWEQFAEEQRQRRCAADAGGGALYARIA